MEQMEGITNQLLEQLNEKDQEVSSLKQQLEEESSEVARLCGEHSSLLRKYDSLKLHHEDLQAKERELE